MSTIPADTAKKIGVYCLANDRVIEWFQLFARSLRHFNPDLPLAVIPYNTEVARLKLLGPQFHFDLIPEVDAARFDELEDKVMKVGQHAGMFRKWATFFGPFDEFIFFDADVAVTMPLDDIFFAFARSNADFLYFDTDITMVYREEYIAEMQAQYHSPGFNAGTYVSRKGVVNWEQLWQKAEEAAKVRHMFPPIQDQPFLNYIMDTLPRRTASVNTLLPELSAKPWARMSFQRDSRRDRLVDAQGRVMPFVHWAGCGYPYMVRPEIFLYYRTLGMRWTERINYRREFYWPRCRRQLKNILLKSKLTAGLVERHERLKKTTP